MLEINKIYNEDCLEGMKKIDDGSIDMILCDLPYGSTQCRWDVVIPFDPLWREYKRVIKDNGAIVLFGTQPFTSLLVNSNLLMFRYEWIYEKTQPSGHLNAKKMPMKYHENILVFYKKPPVYNPIKTMGHARKVSKGQIVTRDEVGMGCYGAQENGANYDSTERYPKSIITVSNGLMKQKSLHPTQKPVELFKYLIKTYTNEDDLVLDNCIGSGTTAIACMETYRNFIGFEKDKKYFGVAEKRISDYMLAYSY
ncbi:site-specific DNA-methyltransferase [Lachnospiraceae bacterium ASD3451]|uniref:Methyltransferase n=2 Tax=Diplocloster agilis TaxID=2850323 RepID=A0A949K5A7_9FIRM|nr:site-specific DNA-methyltransferase [Diplocloster agilis]MBU9739345.1 site-specific DNA-methyltransferase [Diplocloster agilis]MBU9747237.1 site-specific DNA-methyltransferase [Diplocloster agilis]